MTDMNTNHFDLLVSYKEMGRPVSDDELRNAFNACIMSAQQHGEVHHDDWLDYSEEMDRQTELLEKWVLERVSPIIRSIVCS